MRTVSPNTGADEVTIAEDQLEYVTLTVARYHDARGVVYLLSRWRLTDDEKVRVAAGEDLYLALMTFGEPMQPICIQVGAEGWAGGAEETERRITTAVSRELMQRRIDAHLESLARESEMLDAVQRWAALLGLDAAQATFGEIEREIRRLVEKRTAVPPTTPTEKADG